ncbi:MEDS domain-containing protein [Halanaerobaculum tunisiense]
MSRSMNESSGLHSSFYYLNKEHLFVNIYNYIIDAIKNKKLIYISMKPELYHELINKTTLSPKFRTKIEFHSVKKLITDYKKGQNSIKENIKKQESLNNNYTGIRWIGQPSYIIQKTSKKDFLDWEQQLTKSFKETNSSMLCIYNFNDYLENEDIIDEKIINESLKTHSHILNQFRFKKRENLFQN